MNKPKNIAILSVTEGRGHGAEVVLAELLRAWNSADLKMTIIAPGESRVYEEASGCGFEVIAFPSSRDALKSNLSSAWTIRRECSRFDLIHGWTARTFEPSLVLGSAKQQRVTATLHDHPLAGFHGALRRTLMKQCSRALNGLVCVSDAVRRQCRDVGYAGELAVIHNGLNDPGWVGHSLLNAQSVSSSATEEERNAPVRVAFLGMYAPWKGFSLVSEWIRKTAGDSRIVWDLYGDVLAEFEPILQKLRNDGARMEIHGRQDAMTIFSRSDILVHASTSFDPLPTVLIEAMRSGIPAIASRPGGSAEIVNEGVTGFIFDPEKPEAGLSRLQQLCSDPVLRRRMGAAARDRFETHFQVSRMVEAYASWWLSRTGTG